MKLLRSVRRISSLVVSVLLFHSAAASDDLLLAARDAARLGDRAKLERIAPEVQGHALDAYVEYWLFQIDLKREDADPAAIKSFLTRNEGSYIAERMRGDWLKKLGKDQLWAEFDAEFPAMVQPDQEVACYALQSRHARGDQSVLDDAMPLWLTLVEPPESCYPVFEALIMEKRVLADDV